MRKANFNLLLLFAESQQDRFAISRAVHESRTVAMLPNAKGEIEPTVIIDVPALREKLTALGCTILIDPRRKFENVTQVDVMHGNDLLACGTSFDEADALLHAMLGFVRERNIDGLKEAGMSHGEAVDRSKGTGAVLNP